MTAAPTDLLLAPTPVDPKRYTDAPLRMRGRFVFAAPASTVFDRVTDPRHLASWFPTIHGGEVDHSASERPGGWGAGSKRYCHARGMGTLDETVVVYEPPRAFAYRVRNRMMPIRDHLAVMHLTDGAGGGTVLEWHQYFHLTGIVRRRVFPTMMAMLMTRGMNRLARELGGEGGRMVVVA